MCEQPPLLQPAPSERSARTETIVFGRGTVRVGGALWQYVRSDVMLLAAVRMTLPPDASLRFDGAETRARVSALLTGDAARPVLEATGRFLREAEALFTREFTAYRAAAQFPVGFADTPTPLVLDGNAFPFVIPFLGVDARFTIARIDDRHVRLDGPRVRMVTCALDTEPVLVFGGEAPAPGTEFDVTRLSQDRDYARGHLRDALPRIEANVGPAALREGSPAAALAAVAELAERHEAPEDAMFLRELAHAAAHHGFTWAELDADRAQA